MSLRAKFYLSFAVMILLVIITGGMAIRAFLLTGDAVDDTQTEVGMVSSVLAPATDLVNAIYTDVNQASLFYRSYSFSRGQGDFDSGTGNIKQIRDRTARLEDQIRQPRAAALTRHLGTLEATHGDVNEMEKQARRLQELFAQAEKMQGQLDERMAAVKRAADESLLAALNSIAAGLAHAGENAPPTASPETVAFLSEFIQAASRAETSFWQGRALTGEAATAKFAETEAETASLTAKMRQFIDGSSFALPETRQSLENVYRNLQAYGSAVTEFIAEWGRTEQINLALSTASDRVLDAFDSLDEATSGEMLDATKDAHAATERIDDIVNSSTRLSLIILLAAVVIGAVFAVVITRGVVTPIVGVIGSLTRGEQIISSAADQISSASHDLAEGVGEQASSLEETSSALEQVSSMTQNNASNAKTTNENIRRASGLVSEGAKEMENMSGAMTDINAKADQISRIIKTIEDIAFQTNLLALNAAVEAARAGEAGKGFAVVADEVRNLSGRSAQAAKDTADLINGTVESIRGGSSILGRLSTGYQEIEQSVNEIKDLVQQIEVAAHEQAQGTEQINAAISQMDKVTQQNAAGASESASSVQNLNDQISDLHDNITLLSSIIHGTKQAASGREVATVPEAAVPGNLLLSGPQVMRPTDIL